MMEKTTINRIFFPFYSVDSCILFSCGDYFVCLCLVGNSRSNFVPSSKTKGLYKRLVLKTEGRRKYSQIGGERQSSGFFDVWKAQY